MFKKVIKYFYKIYKRKIKEKEIKTLIKERKEYIRNGCIPWSKGYEAYKQDYISNAINDDKLINNIKNRSIPNDFGFRLDERAIEYPWIMSKLDENKCRILDAGSTFNYEFLINHKLIKNKDLTILTFAPEKNCFHDKRISYVYDDLRSLPFKKELFDVIISQSTIEHIDMDNSIYGYSLDYNKEVKKKSFEYIKAIKEMIRVLKPKGVLVLTFPFGKFENHGFFQQFDNEMLLKTVGLFKNLGIYEIDFFRYGKEGWRFANKGELKDVVSYNPHSGKGKLNDGAAHCRSIACINFIKN